MMYDAKLLNLCSREGFPKCISKLGGDRTKKYAAAKNGNLIRVQK